jgi:hypothetical protein
MKPNTPKYPHVKKKYEGSEYSFPGYIHCYTKHTFTEFLLTVSILFIWLRIGTSEGLLQAWQGTFRFHKILGNS